MLIIFCAGVAQVCAQSYNWTNAAAPVGGWVALASSSDGHISIAASTLKGNSGTGIYLSSDFGHSWKNIFINGVGVNEAFSHVAISVDGTTMFALQQGLGLYTSTNGGGSWERSTVDAALFSPYFAGLSCSAYGDTVFVAVSSGYIYYSNNYGRAFTKSKATPDYWYSLTSSQGGSLVFATSSYVSRSIDGGNTWSKTTLPQRNWMAVAMSTDGSRVVAVAGADQYSDYHTGGIYTSSDSGNSWTMTSASTNLDWSTVASDQTGQYLQAAATGNGQYFSNDWGKTWFLNALAPNPASWKKITSDRSGQSSAVGIISGSSGRIIYGST